MEGKITFLIPSDKRQEYFIFVDKLKAKFPFINDEIWNTYSDPLITIDFSGVLIN